MGLGDIEDLTFGPLNYCQDISNFKKKGANDFKFVLKRVDALMVSIFQELGNFKGTNHVWKKIKKANHWIYKADYFITSNILIY